MRTTPPCQIAPHAIASTTTSSAFLALNTMLVVATAGLTRAVWADAKRDCLEPGQFTGSLDQGRPYSYCGAVRAVRFRASPLGVRPRPAASALEEPGLCVLQHAQFQRCFTAIATAASGLRRGPAGRAGRSRRLGRRSGGGGGGGRLGGGRRDGRGRGAVGAWDLAVVVLLVKRRQGGVARLEVAAKGGDGEGWASAPRRRSACAQKAAGFCRAWLQASRACATLAIRHG
jgi:hypothetical protein